MIPFILPTPSNAATNGARRDVELTSHPLASPKSSLAPAQIEWHPQPYPSPSLSAFHDQQSASQGGIGSRSFVEFHHNQLDPPEDLHLGTTQGGTSVEVSQVRDRGEYSVNSRMGGGGGGTSMAEHAANMPTVLTWPLHPHPLHYAGSSSGDSLRIMTCRNCRSEHYNSAVYSCVERGCNFHICLACALEQLSAVSEAKREAGHQIKADAAGSQGGAAPQRKKTRKGSKETEAEDKAEALMRPEDRVQQPHRWDHRAQGVGEGELVMSHKMEPGVTAIDVGQAVPISYTRDRLRREYDSTKAWIAAVEYDASALSLRLVTPCSLHAEHVLIYHAISPPPPLTLPSRKPSAGSPSSSSNANTIRLQPTLTDRYFCDAVLSPFCMSHDLNKHLRPVYACPHCNFRLCLPCYRWYLLDHFSRLRSSMSYEAADERIELLMREYNRTRAEDNRAIAYSEVMFRREAQWEDKRRSGHLVAGVSTLLAIVLVNAVLTMTDAGVAYQLLNVLLILIGALTAALAASSLSAYALRSHQRCLAHQKTIDGLYLDPSLSYFFHTPRTSPIPIAAVTPKQRDRLSDIYHHHNQVLQLQTTVLRSTWLALALLIAGCGLLVSGVVVLLIDVVCGLQVYDGVEWCEVRAGVPVAVLLMAVLMWGLWLDAIARGWTWLRRTGEGIRMHRREERQRTKWQRRE